MAAHSVQPWMRVVGGQHQEAGRHQELVGDRIEHPAKSGLLVPHSCIVAIEVIGHPRGDKDGQRHPAQPQRAIQDGLGKNAADHHRNGGDARVGQDIRQGQALGLSLGGCDVHPSYQYRWSVKVNRAGLSVAGDARMTRIPLTRLRMEKFENLAGAFGADAWNLAEIGDRGPLDLLQRSKMMQQGTFA